LKTKLKLASAQGGTKIKAVAQLKMKFLIVILSVVEESPKTIHFLLRMTVDEVFFFYMNKVPMPEILPFVTLHSE